jgi:hypothetical protein
MDITCKQTSIAVMIFMKLVVGRTFKVVSGSPISMIELHAYHVLDNSIGRHTASIMYDNDINLLSPLAAASTIIFRTRVWFCLI